MKLEGKTTVITGSSKGIGKVIAQVFAQNGANVVLSSRSEQELKPVEQLIKQEGNGAICIAADMRDKKQVKNLIDTAYDYYGSVDILINNAGLPMYGFPIDDQSPEAEERFEDIVRTNFQGYWYAARYAIPYIKETKNGCIINISSVRGRNALANETAYCAVKGAVNMFTKSLAIELAPFNIRVNAISPGAIQVDTIGHWVLSRYGKEVHEEYVKKYKDVHLLGMKLNQPLSTIGKPEDVAYAAMYLASEEARFITGADLVIDGGLTCVLAEPGALDLNGLSEYTQKSENLRKWLASLD